MTFGITNMKIPQIRMTPVQIMANSGQVTQYIISTQRKQLMSRKVNKGGHRKW